jgi:hypothetical protein
MQRSTANSTGGEIYMPGKVLHFDSSFVQKQKNEIGAMTEIAYEMFRDLKKSGCTDKQAIKILITAMTKRF